MYQNRLVFGYPPTDTSWVGCCVLVDMSTSNCLNNMLQVDESAQVPHTWPQVQQCTTHTQAVLRGHMRAAGIDGGIMCALVAQVVLVDSHSGSHLLETKYRMPLTANKV